MMIASFGAACHRADEERGGWGGLAQGRWEGASRPRPGRSTRVSGEARRQSRCHRGRSAVRTPAGE
eukprot:2221493-Rhodomonas_salina.1